MKHQKSKPKGSPCDIPPFCRNNYFTGKLLTERDFTAEQQYVIDKLRLHDVALHGWGVVGGLKVVPHHRHPDLRLVIEPGLAVDGCGRQIRVPEAVERELPTLGPSPTPAEGSVPADSDSGEYVVDAAALKEQAVRASGQLAVDLYVYLRYAEQEAEPTPALFSEGIGGNDRKPNRIFESYELEIATDKPECFERIKSEMDAANDKDYDAIYEGLLGRSMEPSDIECIPLAVIHGFIPGQALKKESIDNDTYRRWLPSTTSLHQLIRYILARIPARRLTRIVEIGWTHRREYSTQDFMKLFIGEYGSSSGFEVTFDGPVRPEGISARTFQAIAVHYPEKLEGAGQPEVVPAKVRLNHDHTKAHLHIDQRYARNRLEQTHFDLYLLLRCNLVLDSCGLPVDGELLARLDSDRGYVSAAFPTGDGLPGGLFETWIRVRHGGTH